MPKFDTDVQELKYRVLKEVARAAYDGTLLEEYNEIPKKISPGPDSNMRCCIYKERAIVADRIKLALGGNKSNPNVVEVISIACDECPLGGYEVLDRCRGCLAHRCKKACPRDAIIFDERTRRAIIDKTKCVNCGLCAKACQYNAIQNFLRPCEQACKVKAISVGEDFAAKINDEKCVQCGACVYQCPFGAIMDKSSIVDVINDIRDSDFSKKYPVYAIVAPAISAQYESLGKIITAIKRLGFHNVIEAALGADLVAYNEAKELEEKGFLTSSCCPTFVAYIKKNFPKLIPNISHNPSPMAALAKWIKENEPTAKVVFIGPCVSKKMEIKQESVKPYVDYVLTFEELQALIDARNIDLESLEESPLDNASYFGRIFARVGGLSDAVVQALKEQESTFEVKSYVCDGIENFRLALLKAQSGKADFNFIEGMGCIGGCIGGPCCLNHEVKDKTQVDKYGKMSKEQTIKDSIRILQ